MIYMFDFFDLIISFLETIVSFIGNMVLTIIYVIDFILEGVFYVFTIIAYLPPWLMAFVVAVISFSVIMFLINR